MSVIPAGYKQTEVGVIPGGWDVTSLGNLSEFITSGSRGWASYYSDRGALFVRSQNVRDGQLDFTDRQFVNPPKGSEGNRTRLKRSDLLITITGNSVGNIALVEQDLGEAYISQHVGLVRLSEPERGTYICRFLAPGSVGNEQIFASQSGQSKPGLSLRNLQEFLVAIPPLPEQRAIAAILGALDDKIELNRATNATLEEIARTLFTSWFVEFAPVRAKAAGHAPHGMDAATAALFPDSLEDSPLGLVPEGWRVESLDRIATYLNGLALQKFPAEDDEYLPVIKIAQLRKGNTEGSDRASTTIPAAYIVDDGDVLFSWSGSLEVVLWCGGRGALNQHLFKVTSQEYPKWFYYFWTKHHLGEFQAIASGKATTMGHIQRHHLSAAHVFIPSPELLQYADEVIASMLDKLIALNIQMRQLKETRDTLLPKLLSSALRVKDIEASL